MFCHISGGTRKYFLVCFVSLLSLSCRHLITCRKDKAFCNNDLLRLYN